MLGKENGVIYLLLIVTLDVREIDVQVVVQIGVISVEINGRNLLVVMRANWDVKHQLIIRLQVVN